MQELVESLASQLETLAGDGHPDLSKPLLLGNRLSLVVLVNMKQQQATSKIPDSIGCVVGFDFSGCPDGLRFVGITEQVKIRDVISSTWHKMDAEKHVQS